jgi:hypothetical protein
MESEAKGGRPQRQQVESRKKTELRSTGNRLRGRTDRPRTVSQCEPPALDERVPGLLLESLASVQAAIASASTGLPYSDLRKALRIGEDEKRELTSAAVSAAAEHPAFLSQHKDVLELAIVWAGMHAQRVDHLFSRGDEQGEAKAQSEHVCTGREAFFSALVILAPLLIFVVVQFLQYRRSNA